MNKQDFIELLENAKQDRYGNLYYIDKKSGIDNRIYFGTVTTICADFVKEYCYKGNDGYEHYNRHFTRNDDTLEICLVKDKNKKVKEISSCKQ